MYQESFQDKEAALFLLKGLMWCIKKKSWIKLSTLKYVRITPSVPLTPTNIIVHRGEIREDTSVHIYASLTYSPDILVCWGLYNLDVCVVDIFMCMLMFVGVYLQKGRGVFLQIWRNSIARCKRNSLLLTFNTKCLRHDKRPDYISLFPWSLDHTFTPIVFVI